MNIITVKGTTEVFDILNNLDNHDFVDSINNLKNNDSKILIFNHFKSFTPESVEKIIDIVPTKNNQLFIFIDDFMLFDENDLFKAIVLHSIWVRDHTELISTINKIKEIHKI